MIKRLKLWTAAWGMAFLFAVCVTIVILWPNASPFDGPTLFCSAFDSTKGMAVVQLTNATNREWMLRLHVVQGVPRPSYFITHVNQGLPGWGAEFEEGIYCSGFLYSRDSYGHYSPPEIIGQYPKLSIAFTNVILQPKQALEFTVPIGEIQGLSKVGVKYQRPPASSQLARNLADALGQVRRAMGFQPAAPLQGWCETRVLLPPDER
jgi:hypothetical protein